MEVPAGATGGEDGHLDGTPAIGDFRYDDNVANATGGACGNGGVKTTEAANGESLDLGASSRTVWGGHGGGGVGRIRIYTAPNGLTHSNGFSPAPITGPMPLDKARPFDCLSSGDHLPKIESSDDLPWERTNRVAADHWGRAPRAPGRGIQLVPIVLRMFDAQ